LLKYIKYYGVKIKMNSVVAIRTNYVLTLSGSVFFKSDMSKKAQSGPMVNTGSMVAALIIKATTKPSLEPCPRNIDVKLMTAS
jgi:hypothetical protein